MAEIDDKVAALERRIAELEAQVDPPRPTWTPPTPAQLKVEIETGPFAARLAVSWADVFGPHFKIIDGQRVRTTDLDYRIGRLKPDAAFGIHKLLTDGGDGSHAVGLGWGNGWSYKLVQEAKKVKG